MSDRSPAMDIADLIRDSESGWTVYVGNEAPSPDNAVTVYDTGGGQANADGPLYDPTIQVRVRSADYVTGYSKVLAIRDMLMIRTARDIGNWHYTGFWLISDVAKIGRDDSDRELFTVNFRMMRERVPAPPSCAITLTGDIATLLGGQPMTISGQTVSISSSEAIGQYYASTATAGSSLPSSGSRIFEVQDAEKGGTDTPFISAIIASGTGSGALMVTREGSSGTLGNTHWGFYISSNSGVSWTLASSVASAITAIPAIGVDSSGNPVAYLDDSVVDVSALGAIFVGHNVFILTSANQHSSGGSASMTIVTTGSSFTRTYPAGTLDWCGNPI